jgi:hypothetical protein
MINSNNFLNKWLIICLKFLLSLWRFVWQKIINLFFAKKKSTFKHEIIAWQIYNKSFNSNFFQNKHIARSKKIRPFRRKIRGLDIENGGLEQSDDKTQKHVKDAWDDRSKNLLQIGQVSPISSSNKKAMLLWYNNLLKKQMKLKSLNKMVKKNKKKLDIPKQVDNKLEDATTNTFTKKFSTLKSPSNSQHYR